MNSAVKNRSNKERVAQKMSNTVEVSMLCPITLHQRHGINGAMKNLKLDGVREETSYVIPKLMELAVLVAGGHRATLTKILVFLKTVEC